MSDTAENALMTHEQRYRARKSEVMFISRSLITSKAFLSLSATACKVLLIFMTKRRFEKVQGKRGKRDNPYICTNNGEIVFPYAEAKNKYHISEGRFTRAIDELVAKGFIDIAESGFGLQKSTSKYALSERWRAYGTPEFVLKHREKRPERLGFKKGNILGRNCQKKISTVAGNSESTVADNSCEQVGIK